MKTSCAFSLLALAYVGAFNGPSPMKSGRRLSSITMEAKSRSIPFAPQPKNLDGTLPGDWIVPNKASMRSDSSGKPIVDTLYWMTEAELKHGRVAMLAVVGWIATDFGLRFPGSKYLDLTPMSAHDALVTGGNMVVMLHFALLLELINGAAIFAAARGSGRKAGDFAIDPLGLSKDNAKKARYQLSEVKNGRLAMLAFSGIATQAVLTGHGFPYLF